MRLPGSVVNRIETPGNGPPKLRSEFTKEELLWLCRTTEEGDHHYSLYFWQLLRHWNPTIQTALDNPDNFHAGDHVLECFNKTVPMYFLPSRDFGGVPTIFHNYIYRRWFRPYRTEVNLGQFPCRFITPSDADGYMRDRTGPPSKGVINALIRFNGILCAAAARCHQEHEESHKGQMELDLAAATRKIPWHRSHILRPLFKALMAVVCCTDYKGEDSKTAGPFRVYLVRTGVTDNLSRPVSFADEVAAKRMKYLQGSRSVVETTLEHALDFILALESREEAIFGIQPSLLHVVDPPIDDAGNYLTTVPSSQWVSDERAAEWGWCGRGKVVDEEDAVNWEKKALRPYKRRMFEEQMAREVDSSPRESSLKAR